MIGRPAFASAADFVARLGDVGFWSPYVAEVLRRHGLADAGRQPAAGFNPTYPTFLCGDVVVKLFGYAPAWRAAFAAERAAYASLARDPDIPAPRLVAEGRLDADPDAPWPYLVTTRMAGTPARDAALSRDGQLALARDLGSLVRRIHALPASHVRAEGDWRALDVAAAAARSSLPAHLVAQAAGFVSRIESLAPVFAHGDLTGAHVFVAGGRLRGVVDWGDARLADPHYELVQVHRDLFGCDKALLRAFLDGSNWPVRGDFARRALGLALCRQAVGLTEHHTMDVFEPVAAALPLDEIATLDELARELFGV